MITHTPHSNEQRHESRASSTFTALMRDVQKATGLDEDAALLATLSVLTRLEQHLASAVGLEAQLPSKLRELLTLLRNDAAMPPPPGAGAFDALVAKDLRLDLARASRVVDGVFTTIRQNLSAGEVDNVSLRLPERLRQRWSGPRLRWAS